MKKEQVKVNTSVVRMALVEGMLDAKGLSAGGTDQQKLERLQAWYQKNTPKSRIADCSTCGGESDVEEPRCPYCGDGEVADEQAVDDVPATSGKTSHDPPATPPPPAPSSEAAPAPAGETLNIPPAPPPPVGLVPYRRGAKRAVPKVVETTGVEIVTPPPTEEALNDAVQHISDLMIGAADKLWEVGNAIKEVFEQGLWTARKNDDGSAKYKSWGHFCEVELGISHGHSLKLIDVAREFTREQVRQIGPTKLHITLQVPKGEARDRLLGIAPSVNKAELAKAAKAEVEAEASKPKAARSTGRGGKGKAGKGGAGSHVAGPPRTGGRKPDKITVAMLVNRVEISPLNEKGAKQKLKIGSPLVAEERLFNGVRQRVIVTNDDDGFVLVIIERSRE